MMLRLRWAAYRAGRIALAEALQALLGIAGSKVLALLTDVLNERLLIHLDDVRCATIKQIGGEQQRRTQQHEVGERLA